MPIDNNAVMTDLIEVSSAATYLSDLWNKIHREGVGTPVVGPRISTNGLNFSSARFNSAIATLSRAPGLAATVSTAVNDSIPTLIAAPSTGPHTEPQLTCTQLRLIIIATERELLNATPKEKPPLEAALSVLKAQAKGCPEV